MFSSSERCIAASCFPCHSGNVSQTWCGNSLHKFWLSCRRRIHCSAYLRRTHYEALGISSNATLAQIKSAYYQQSKLLHPDNAVTLDPKEQLRLHNAFVELNKAYEVLRRASSRKEYDDFLSGRMSPGGMNFHGASRPPNRPNPQDWYSHWYTANQAYHNSFRPRRSTPLSKMEKQLFFVLFLFGVMFLSTEITRLMLFARRRRMMASLYSRPPNEERFTTQDVPVYDISDRAYSSVPQRTSPLINDADIAKQWLETINDYDRTKVCLLTGEKV